MFGVAWEIIASHDKLILAAALMLALVSAFLTAINLERMRSMSIQRKVPLVFISGCINGLSIWTMQMGLLASYLPWIDLWLSGTSAVLQIAVSVVWFSTLAAMSQSPKRWHHQVALFFIPIFPAFINFWMIMVLFGQGLAQIDSFLQAIALLSVFGLVMALTAPREPLEKVAPVVPFMLLSATLGFLAHITMLTVLELTPDAISGLNAAMGPARRDAGVALLLPLGFANVLILAVGSANFSMDVAGSCEALARYRALAMTDPLTQMPNRASYRAFVEDFLAGSETNGLAIALLDLDHFKEVNDRHGHAAGDALLVGLSQHITMQLGDGERLFRLGGDEFVATKIGVASVSDAERFGSRINAVVQGFESPVTGDIKVGASVGISVYPAHGTIGDLLLSRADIAMYRAKQRGRNMVCTFDIHLDGRSAKMWQSA